MAKSSRPSSRRQPSRAARFIKRYKRVEDMPVLHLHAAGIDLAGAADHFVAVEIGDEIEVRAFGGTTQEVLAMVAYLVDQGVTTVAMESTGVYWMVVYDLAALCALIPLSDVEVAVQVAAHVAATPPRHDTGKHAPTFPVVSYIHLLTDRDPTCLPGLAATSSLGLLAELGRDMSKWPSVKHFSSYLTLAPVQEMRGGKMRRSATRPGVHPAAVIFKQAAAAVTRTDTALGAYYRRLAVRMSRGKALTATARKIAEQYDYLMRYGREYVDIGAQHSEEQYRQRQVAALTKQAAKLGLTLTVAA